MANIHFIWWGPCPPEGEKLQNCIGSPFYLAENIPGHRVIFWCKDGSVKAFQEKFRNAISRVDVRSCSQIKKVVGLELYEGEGKTFFKNAMDSIHILNKMKAYSAVKDLLSLIILYAHGGFYFDTTTIIDNYRKLSDYLIAPRNKRVPGIAGGTMGYLDSLQMENLITRNKTNAREYKDWDMEIPQIDVWAMYSPPRDLATELMFKSYVSRCNRVGVYPGAKKSIGIQTLDPNSEGNKDIKNKNRDRNELIGFLVILSVCDGLVTVCCEGHGDRLNAFCWNATTEADLVEGKYKADKVAELGLTKYYTGSWKNTTK